MTTGRKARPRVPFEMDQARGWEVGQDVIHHAAAEAVHDALGAKGDRIADENVFHSAEISPSRNRVREVRSQHQLPSRDPLAPCQQQVEHLADRRPVHGRAGVAPELPDLLGQLLARILIEIAKVPLFGPERLRGKCIDLPSAAILGHHVGIRIVQPRTREDLRVLVE